MNVIYFLGVQKLILQKSIEREEGDLSAKIPPKYATGSGYIICTNTECLHYHGHLQNNASGAHTRTQEQ